MRFRYFPMLLMGTLLLGAGCKEKDPDGPTETDVTMNVNFRYGTQTLVYGQEYTYDTDKKIKIELVKFYVSKPALRNSAGESVPFDTDYFLVDVDHPKLAAGKFPKDTYTALQFGVGVDNSRNIETDPQAIPATDYPTDHPLNAGADMWWGWATGYIFVKVEGRIDADNNGSYVDVDDKTISYHPGVSDLYRSILLEKTIAVEGETAEFGVSLDVEKLFTNIDLITHPYSHPNSTDHPEYSFSVRMMDNFPTAFE